MSKTLWHTIKLEVPKEMVNITKNDKVVVKKSLTKTNNISKANKEPSIKIIPGDTNKPKIINDGKEWNIEELKLKMKKAKELAKKNEGKEYKKPSVIIDRYGDKTFGNPILKKYKDHLYWDIILKKRFAQIKLNKTNDDGIKYYDIYDICFTKKELIKEYDFFKNKEYKEMATWVFKKLNKEELKYWREELPKQFESSTKDFIIKWFLTMEHYPVKIQYNSNPKYKALIKKMHKENKIVHHSLDF